MRTPEQQPRRVFRRRGNAAEGNAARLSGFSWDAGEYPADCHALCVERCRGRYTIQRYPYEVMTAS